MSAPAAPAAGGDEVVRWTYDPWRERPRTAAAAAVGVLALCAAIAALRLPWPTALALALASAAAFAPALAPVECRLDAAGAAARGPLGWRRRDWPGVRRIEELPAGVLLTPHRRRTWLDGPHGLLLPMPATRHAELAARTRTLREAHGA